MKFLLSIFFSLLTLSSHAQEKEHEVHLDVGLVFNQSSQEWNNTTGIGLYIEGSYFLNDKVRAGVRFEPTALAYGVAVFPGGCEFEHPRYPGIASCREGANFLFNNYIKAEYMLGQPRYGVKGGRKQAYIGVNLLVLMHNRYIITSRETGNWKDTKRLVANLGAGVRFGVLLGRFDMSTAYNRTGDDFRGFVGFNLGYTVWKF